MAVVRTGYQSIVLCVCVTILQATSPDVSPQPDARDGSPVFIQEPDAQYYIVKTKPVKVTCKASPAVQINFKCAGQWVRPKYQENVELIDSDTGIKYLQSSIDVSKEEVENVGDTGYWCECHAWNSILEVQSPQSAQSRRGVIQIAALKKRFEREPLSASVELEDTVQLQCLPPEGLPMPQVFWMKNGIEINVNEEINFIISSEGNLIINQARISDTANYTCGAQNVAGRRLSESATLTVYVNGGWSTWSSWSECSRRCSNGFKRRTRTCDNPSAVHGHPCFGDAVQRLNCTSNCPVDGLWSTWSSWSTCGADCRHHRRRMCDNPAPTRGGLGCHGSDLDLANCSAGICGAAEDSFNVDAAVTNEMAEENIAMYVGLIAAIAVFITVAIIVIFIFKRRFYNSKWCFSGSGSKKFNKHNHDILRGRQPDLTQTVVTIQNQHTLDKPNNNHLHGAIDHASLQRTGTLNHSVNGSVNLNSSIDKDEHIYSNIDTLEKGSSIQKSLQRLLDPSSNVNEHTGLLAESKLSDCETRPNSLYSACNRTSTVSCQLPHNIDVEAIAVANVSHLGGRLSLPESGVSVTIPDGAISKGCTEEVFLAVCRDDKDRPKLNTDAQTVLGPVILLGPQSLALKKPVVLSFQHCASIKHGQWALSVYSTDSSYDEPPQWQCASTLGQETINTPVYTQIDQNQCHIMTDTLQRYVLVGEPNMARKAIKILRLAVFAPAVPPSLDYNIRVYFLEDTRDAFEHVRQVEHELGGRLLEKPKQILFQFGGGNLCLSVEELCPGWRCKLGAELQEIPFFHIWSGTQNGLHCSFALERVDRTQQLLCTTINVFQKEQTNNTQTLQISCNLTEPLSVSASPGHMVNSPHHYHNTAVSGSGHVYLDPPHTVFRLPLAVKQKLGHILDPPNARGNDWRMLAQRLSVDRYINYFATKKSPTEHILDLWEARHREESAITDLMNSLRVMGRMDAAAVLETEFNSWL